MPIIITDTSDAHAARVNALARILWAHAAHLVGDPTGATVPDDLTERYRERAEAVLLLMRQTGHN